VSSSAWLGRPGPSSGRNSWCPNENPNPNAARRQAGELGLDVDAPFSGERRRGRVPAARLNDDQVVIQARARSSSHAARLIPLQYTISTGTHPEQACSHQVDSGMQSSGTGVPDTFFRGPHWEPPHRTPDLGIISARINIPTSALFSPKLNTKKTLNNCKKMY
jgi:hypothetical protein